MTKYLIDCEEYEQDEFQRELEAATYDYAERNYDEELDETYQDYEIMGLSFSASQVLSECDPIAYGCDVNDLADSELRERRIANWRPAASILSAARLSRSKKSTKKTSNKSISLIRLFTNSEKCVIIYV